MARLIKGDPVDTYACPRCEFPMDFHFEGRSNGPIHIAVGCSRCCWMENWGEFHVKKNPEGNEDAA